MKISDRDKKIIIIILIALVIALPYLLLIKPTNEKIVTVEGEIVTLQERYDYLDGLNQQRGFYLSEIERYGTERAAIIADYAEGLRQENIIMFLRGLEFDIPVTMNTVTFGAHELTPIAAGTANEDGTVTGAVDAYKTETAVAYTCDYENIKSFLDYIMKYDDRMVVSALDIAYDDKIGKISGMFVLDQFAITTDDRELAPAVIPSMDHGNESIFGTYISDPELAEQLAEEAEGEEAEGEEAEEE